MLACPRRARERILIYGDTGTSKTTAYLNIARWSQRTHSPATFYVGDTDNAVLDMLDEGYSDLENIIVTPLYEFDEYQDWLKSTTHSIKPDDWIVCDLIGEVWSSVQRYFTDQVFQKDIGNYFLQARMQQQALKPDQKNLTVFEGMKDWTVINKLHEDFINQLCLRNTCHIFAASKANAVAERTDTKATLETYQRFGFKPQGQKYLGHNFRTILFAQHPKKDLWTVQTVKDRERKQLEGEKVTDFTLTYLKGIAGWTL